MECVFASYFAKLELDIRRFNKYILNKNIGRDSCSLFCTVELLDNVTFNYSASNHCMIDQAIRSYLALFDNSGRNLERDLWRN